MTSKTSKSYRLPEVTIEQMERLRQRYGSYTQIIVVAIDRLFREEQHQPPAASDRGGGGNEEGG